MLTSPDAVAVGLYRVPWQVERVSDAHARVCNDGREPADFVRIFFSDARTQHCGSMLAGDAVEICLCDVDLDEVVVTVCWFRRDTGVEYAWRFVM